MERASSLCPAPFPRQALWRLVLVAALAAAPFVHGAPRAHTLDNQLAPDFTLTDLDGRPLKLSSFRGKVVLLNFWATWCAPCQIEMPVFAEWQTRYAAQGLQVVGISMDDDAAPARRLTHRLRLNYPLAMGDEHLGVSYGGVLGLPLTFLIDRRGIVRARFQGETDLNMMKWRLVEQIDRESR